ncbi:hypothetical protein H5410_021591 [Solanum commersonii]|uniref:Uncharacterized protein n=1 Tax=Solanum commersonii TaxID=4109 RepID=A0A9J5ZHN2_SOLCO|nr:hypothetical protein H5410_021591 [Solanum commersonii]
MKARGSPSLLGESLKGKDQVSGEREQSAYCRIVLQSSTMSPNDTGHDHIEGWCKMATKYTKSCKYKTTHVFLACSRERSRNQDR